MSQDFGAWFDQQRQTQGMRSSASTGASSASNDSASGGWGGRLSGVWTMIGGKTSPAPGSGDVEAGNTGTGMFSSWNSAVAPAENDWTCGLSR
jgi:hypothetical protein